MAFVGTVLILEAYARLAGRVIDPERMGQLVPLAHATTASALALFAVGVASSLLQIRRTARGVSLGRRKPGVLATLGEPLLRKHGIRMFTISFLLYYLVFAVLSGSLIVRPGEDFTQVYEAAVPSVQVSLCCGPPGSIPQYSIYIAQGLGLLVLPGNLLLALSISLLSALSVTVSLASFMTPRLAVGGAGSAGVAGAMGVLASCTTCASQAILVFFLGAGALGVAAALWPWQAPLAVATIGILLAALWAQGRWTARLRTSCRPSRATPAVPRPR